MALCAEVTPEGFVKSTSIPAESCTGVLLISPSEYSMNYQLVNVTASDYAAVFFGAFGFVILMASLGWKIKISSRLTRYI